MTPINRYYIGFGTVGLALAYLSLLPLALMYG